MKAKSVSPSIFWAAYRPWAHVVVNTDTVDALLNVTGSWSDHQAMLDEIVQSELGSAMFGFALSVNISAEIGQ